MTNTQTPKRYADVGFAYAALDAAIADGSVRYFRASNRYPATCACCGRRIQAGQFAAKTAPGTLLGVCCILDLHSRVKA